MAFRLEEPQATSMDSAHCFGPFCLLPGQRMLLEDGRPVRLGSRAFSILVALVDRAGEVVSNDDLIAHVWPNAVVEPGALRVHMAGLRKVLKDGSAKQRYVVNIPQKGYSFVAPVKTGSVATLVPPSDAAPAGAAPAHAAAAPPAISAVRPDAATAQPLPAQVTRMIGRDEVVAELLRELVRRRCITVVGPAGMGKTTIALGRRMRLLQLSTARRSSSISRH